MSKNIKVDKQALYGIAKGISIADFANSQPIERVPNTPMKKDSIFRKAFKKCGCKIKKI